MEAYTKIKFDTDHFDLVKFGDRDWRYKSFLGELRSVLPMYVEMDAALLTKNRYNYEAVLQKK